MPKAAFQGVRVRGVAGTVPNTRVDNLVDHAFVPEEDRKKIVGLTGVKGYRKASPEICTSDLCKAAADRLIEALELDRDSVDAIVFATMTPDYVTPSTACVLQDRLGLPQSAVAYDVNMGCSGFMVGLFNACCLIKGAGLERVLVLAGDTQTKLCHPEDKNVVFIMGDAGTATIVEAAPAGEEIVIELRTDGRRFRSLYVPAGGCRVPSSPETRTVTKRADGSPRSDDDIYMDGMEIFKFAATDVVKTIADFMASQGLSAQNVETLFLHQANQFMNDKIARKLGFAANQLPYTIQTYGNTGAASIPLTITSHLSGLGDQRGRHRSVLSGFGIGLSWGVASVDLSDTVALPISELTP